MRCYYEELGVERNANETDIKTAYRKLALRWHPDKNLDCIEVAKGKFQLIQQAYDVLSDSQERAWYDNHREQILRGKNSNYEENCLNVFEFFTESCYKDYSDDPNSFYAVYAEVFNKIACEDVEFMDDDEEIAFIPKFGNSTSDYDEVVAPFYAYWQSYCTKKTYTWLCPYDIKEVKERRILREIEKKMKKIVQKARKARNEEVRILVSFVRKRDKRVEAQRMSQEASAALRKIKQEQDRLARVQRRQEEVEKMRHEGGNIFNDAYEEQLKLLEKQYHDDSADEEAYTNGEECEDDSNNSDMSASYNSQRIDDEKVETIVGEEEEEVDSDEFSCVICDKSFKSKRALANHRLCKRHLDKMEEVKEEMLREEKHYQDSLQNSMVEEAALYAEEKKANGAYATTVDNHDAEEDEGKLMGRKSAKSSKNKEPKSKKCTNKLNDEATAKQLNEDDCAAGNQSDNESKALKKKAAAVAKSKNKPTKQKASVEDSTKFACVSCGAAFESKNKLFAHLKLTNHSVYVPKVRPSEAEQGAKRPPKGKRSQ